MNVFFLQQRQSRQVCNLRQSQVSNKRKNNEQFRVNKRIRNSNINQTVEKIVLIIVILLQGMDYVNIMRLLLLMKE